MGNREIILIFSIILTLIFGTIGCNSDKATPTPTYISTPTSTAYPTATPSLIPTETANPTASPVPTKAALFLVVSQPFDGAQVSTSTVTVTGMTIPDAVVSLLVDDEIEIADVDEQGSFSAVIALIEGPNYIEVLASDQEGNEEYSTLVVIYIP